MPCFADLEPGNYGPGRVTQQEIRDTFRDGWSGTSIRPAVFGSRTRAEGSCAWRSLKKITTCGRGVRRDSLTGLLTVMADAIRVRLVERLLLILPWQGYQKDSVYIV
jgi:hypothetical protein